VKKLGVGLFGLNGHQVHGQLANHRRAQLVATADVDGAALPPALASDGSISHYQTFDELLADARVELVVLCSRRRSDQAGQAIRAMAAGKHVYAEKPCAMREADIDDMLTVAARYGRHFHEMAGTAFEQPYRAMRRMVAEGRIGLVVQVLAQKSYPYHDRRPQDEAIDGGLIGQNAVHALRFIEHISGVQAVEITAVETALGNPVAGGGLRMASSLMMRLANGGIASAIANYLNPPGFGLWGNEMVRVFGTQGMIEATDGGRHTRAVVGAHDLGPIDTSEGSIDYFDAFVDALLDGAPMPMSLEEELHPTRMVLRAKAELVRGS